MLSMVSRTRGGWDTGAPQSPGIGSCGPVLTGVAGVDGPADHPSPVYRVGVHVLYEVYVFYVGMWVYSGTGCGVAARVLGGSIGPFFGGEQRSVGVPDCTSVHVSVCLSECVLVCLCKNIDTGPLAAYLP